MQKLHILNKLSPGLIAKVHSKTRPKSIVNCHFLQIMTINEHNQTDISDTPQIKDNLWIATPQIIIYKSVNNISVCYHF